MNGCKAVPCVVGRALPTRQLAPSLPPHWGLGGVFVCVSLSPSSPPSSSLPLPPPVPQPSLSSAGHGGSQLGGSSPGGGGGALPPPPPPALCVLGRVPHIWARLGRRWLSPAAWRWPCRGGVAVGGTRGGRCHQLCSRHPFPAAQGGPKLLPQGPSVGMGNWGGGGGWDPTMGDGCGQCPQECGPSPRASP